MLLLLFIFSFCPQIQEANSFGVPIVTESWLTECEKTNSCVLLKDHLLACSSKVDHLLCNGKQRKKEEKESKQQTKNTKAGQGK